MRETIYIAAGGALGALSRYGLSLLAYQVAGDGFAYGTLIINVSGSGAFGFIMQVGLRTEFMSDALRMALTIGFLGAFTTFSTFSYETLNYLQEGAWGHALFNITANVGLGIGAAILGMALGRAMLRV